MLDGGLISVCLKSLKMSNVDLKRRVCFVLAHVANEIPSTKNIIIRKGAIFYLIEQFRSKESTITENEQDKIEIIEDLEKKTKNYFIKATVLDYSLSHSYFVNFVPLSIDEWKNLQQVEISLLVFSLWAISEISRDMHEALFINFKPFISIFVRLLNTTSDDVVRGLASILRRLFLSNSEQVSTELNSECLGRLSSLLITSSISTKMCIMQFFSTLCCCSAELNAKAVMVIRTSHLMELMESSESIVRTEGYRLFGNLCHNASPFIDLVHLNGLLESLNKILSLDEMDENYMASYAFSQVVIHHSNPQDLKQDIINFLPSLVKMLLVRRNLEVDVFLKAIYMCLSLGSNTILDSFISLGGQKILHELSFSSEVSVSYLAQELYATYF